MYTASNHGSEISGLEWSAVHQFLGDTEESRETINDVIQCQVSRGESN
jgi:hypothetical protein